MVEGGGQDAAAGEAAEREEEGNNTPSGAQPGPAPSRLVPAVSGGG